jgi:putative ABC transport system permease protein
MSLVAALLGTIPLFSQQTQNQGLQNALLSSTANQQITIIAQLKQPSVQNVGQIEQHLQQVVASTLGKNIVRPATDFGAESVTQLAVVTPSIGASTLSLLNPVAIPAADLPRQFQLVGGRFPQRAQPLEIDLTPATAQDLHAQIGTTLQLDSYPAPSGHPIEVVVVGLVLPIDARTAMNVAPTSDHRDTAITASELLLDQTALANTPLAMPNTLWQMQWTYPLAIDQLTASSLDTITAGANALYLNLITNYELQEPSIQIIPRSSFFSTIRDYRARVQLNRVPVTILALLVVAVALVFLVVMVSTLATRQQDVLALLRSRGASRGQLLTLFLGEGALLGIVAGVAGTIVCFPCLSALNQWSHTSAPADSLTGDQIALILPWTGGIALLTIVLWGFLVFRATQRTLLMVRQETTRATNRPLWRSASLDLLALGAVALCLLDIFLANPNLQSSDLLAQSATSTPYLLTPYLLTPPLLLVASLLLFLRAFPFLVSRGARLAARSRSLAPMLALTKIARASQQGQRLIILLSLTLAFVSFAVTALATQSNYVSDFASYQVGADFSGELPPTVGVTPAKVAAAYQRLPGVVGVTLGYRSAFSLVGAQSSTAVDENGNALIPTAQVMAIQPESFARAAIWNTTQTGAPLSTVLASLTAQRDAALSAGVIPVIVDDAFWSSQRLRTGQEIKLPLPDAPAQRIPFRVIGHIAHIPSIFDGQDGYGMLADMDTYTAIVAQLEQAPTLAPNFVWLKTSSDAPTLIAVRKALTQGPLQLRGLPLLGTVLPVGDRAALISTLANNPLTLNVSGVLIIGVLVASLLMLVGVIVAVGAGIQQDQEMVALLRALGAAPSTVSQLALVEQASVSIIAGVLGVGLATLLTLTFLPIVPLVIRANAFTIAIPSGVPTVQPVAPFHALAIVLGGFLALGIVTTGSVSVITRRAALRTMLRLNHD